jgi:uncharacterized protein YcbX
VSEGHSRVVGRVVALHRFPVKSMAGETPQELDLRWTGARGDREYGFVFADRPSRFPWFTGRDLSALTQYRAIARDYAPAGLPVEIRTPDGRGFAVSDPALKAELEARAGRPLQLVQLSRGTYDSMPVSVASTASFAALDGAHGGVVDPGRFRINIVVESDERDSDWRGQALHFGEQGPVLAMMRPIERCAMITIDPATGTRDPSIMRTVARAFGNELGEYGSVLRTGRLRVGDAVSVAPMTVPAIEAVRASL